MRGKIFSILGPVVASACSLVSCNDNNPFNPTLVPSRSFFYPSGKGITWVYSNRFRQSTFPGYTYTREDRWGIQTWKVESSAVNGSDTVVLITSAIRDSIHVLRYEQFGWTGPRDTTINSTAIQDTSVSVTLWLKRDSIRIDLSAALYKWKWPEENQIQFPRLMTAGTDTVDLWRMDVFNSIFVHGAGLVFLHEARSGNTYSIGDSLTLVDSFVDEKGG